MREPRLVGRERAMSVLDDLVAGLSRGRGATTGISGAAGTGRTALLSRVLAAAPGASASCVPDGVPFGAVTQLAAALVPPAEFGDLVSACLDERERAAGRLCDAFAGLAAERALVLAVDDLQWADEWSLRWFAEMSGRTGDVPVLLVATAYEPFAEGIPLAPLTPAETATLVRRVLGELPAEVETAVLDVVRGRPAVLHELAAQWATGSEDAGPRWDSVGAGTGRVVTPAGPAERQAAATWSGQHEVTRPAGPHDIAAQPEVAGPAVTSAAPWTAAAGRAVNQPGARWDPVRAAAAGWAVPGGRWDPARVAAAGRAVVSARAARIRRGLPAAALTLLRAMSVSERLDVVAAVGLAEVAAADVPGALSALEASGLVADGRPAEPHLAADVLAELTEPERDGLYRRGAELAHRTGAGALVAAELLRSAPPVGEPWARAVLEEAAEQWSAQGNPVAAAESLRRALTEPAAPAERAALLVRLASAVVRREPDHADRRLVQVLAEPALATLPAAATAADLLLARGDADTVHRLVAEPGRASTVDPTLAALGRLAREEAAADPEMPVPPLPGPDPAGLDTIGPDTARPDAFGPGTAHPATARPGTAGPDTTGPAATHPDTARPDAFGPGTAHPATARPGTAGPDTTGPAAAGSGAVGQGTAAPDTGRPAEATNTTGPAAAGKGEHSAPFGLPRQNQAALDPDTLGTQNPAAAGIAAFRLAVRGEQRGAVLDLAARALVVREEAPLMPRIAACRALLWAGALVDAVEGLTVLVSAARRRDARAAAAQALVHRAAAALRDDRAEEALRDLAAADRELPVRCWHPLAVPVRAAVEITAQLRLGRLEHARHLGAEPLPRGGDHGAAAAFLRHAEAELALAEDDPAAALHAALECGRVLRSRGWVNPMVALWRTTASLALRRLGDHGAAAALAAEELALAERWGTAAALEALRDRGAAGSRRAVPAPRRPADPLPAPRFPVPRPDALSPAERDVAELAARGLANREIARELSIALRTVELRLTKVYRKLGLKGRAALADHWPTRTPGG
ncbi:AAA family ATPase [Amycolatopsis sp. cg9]|uniref:helix-turn-helix transcriptional regulator n=1 Tax=Amycolatopsis sp. cg9 TaxID=3238801 RepID=UPI0035256B8D